MIAAFVRIDGDDYDWFNGLCEFPVLPPIGSTIRIIDKNANMRELRVKDIEVQGVSSATRKELSHMYGDLDITIVCTKF